ncbi:MAG TPA: DUF6460 domain-containing protein [Hyphomicrobiales bacterium]|nr:DUF6460 domain-containing protein [Hyphomicrobiales bacterium]
MAGPTLHRFFGGSPGWVLVRLILLSVVIGVIFSVLGIQPWDIVDAVRRALRRIWEMGFDAIREAFSYFLLGAVIVFPVWLVLRLLKLFGNSSRSERD